MMDLKVDIGKAIKTGLAKKEWTQQQLAEKIGVKASTISLWANNTRKPPADKLIIITILLDIVDELFPAEEVKRIQNMQIQEDINKYEKEIVRLKGKL